MFMFIFMGMRNNMKTLLQTSCIILLAIGIAYEIYYKAPFGYVCITIGAFAFGISTKFAKR